MFLKRVTHRPRQCSAFQTFVDPRHELLQQDPRLQAKPRHSHVNRVTEQVGISRQSRGHIKELGVVLVGEFLENAVLKCSHSPQVRIAGGPIRAIQIGVEQLMSRQIESIPRTAAKAV